MSNVLPLAVMQLNIWHNTKIANMALCFAHTGEAIACLVTSTGAPGCHLRRKKRKLFSPFFLFVSTGLWLCTLSLPSMVLVDCFEAHAVT